MDGRFDVTRAGALIGEARLSKNGLMQDINFSGSAPDSENVYRLAAVCGEQYVLLGVPVPDRNGTLTLKKSLSRTTIRALGLDSPTAFELVLPGESYGSNEKRSAIEPDAMPESIIAEITEEPDLPLIADVAERREVESGDWRPIANPSVMFAENGALSTTDEIKGAIIRETGELVLLAIPISESEPFPLMSAFCLGEPQTIDGIEYLVFKLKNGAFTA